MLWDVQKKGKFEVLRLSNGVRVSTMTIGVNSDSKVYLIRKYCAGSETDELVLPGGQVELNETVDKAAVREFFEEVGKHVTHMELLGELQILPAYIEAKTVGYCGRVDEELVETLPDSEVKSVLLFEKDEVASLIKKGTIRDARSVAFLLLWLQR